MSFMCAQDNLKNYQDNNLCAQIIVMQKLIVRQITSSVRYESSVRKI